MTHPDIAAIARGLSEAQRRWLVERAESAVLFADGESRWCTFPPANTHLVLWKLGLVLASGLITECGMAVRDHLLSGKQP